MRRNEIPVSFSFGTNIMFPKGHFYLASCSGALSQDFEGFSVAFKTKLKMLKNKTSCFQDDTMGCGDNPFFPNKGASATIDRPFRYSILNLLLLHNKQYFF